MHNLDVGYLALLRGATVSTIGNEVMGRVDSADDALRIACTIHSTKTAAFEGVRRAAHSGCEWRRTQHRRHDEVRCPN